ncbi:MAG: hypothetical protein WDZ83_20530 [Rhizobiaceae bacterium]
MDYQYDEKEQDRVMEARESFSGRLLTDAQFDEGIAITGIIEREIKKSGAFKDKLGDYAYAFARTEKIDAAKAETILRDLFKARTGQSMNQMREQLAEREAKIAEPSRKLAYDFALAVGDMIEKGDKINFNRAFAHQGQELAKELDITDAGAKRIMKEEFKAAEGSDLYDWGKKLEDEFYRPQIEAEKERSRQNGDGDDNGRSRSEDGDGPRRGARRDSGNREAPARRSSASRPRPRP